MEFKHVVSIDVSNYSLYKNINSGQMFRWSEINNRSYIGISGNSLCLASQVDNRVILQLLDKKDEDYWVQLLALRENIEDIGEIMQGSEFMRKAYNFSKGLRILRQEPWDALLGFIISQRNNIPRIKMCVEGVAWSAGSDLVDQYYALPTPEQLLPGSLVNCKLGYREPYLYAAAQAVSSGSLNLMQLKQGSCTLEYAMQELTRVPGVGIKVASCVCLFGLGHDEAFPVDIWIERAIEEGGLSASDIAGFGCRAGLVQQYLYYYMLNRDREV